MSDDQYGDYSRRDEYEGQDPYAGRRGHRTRGGDPGYAAPRAGDPRGGEDPYAAAPPPQGGHGGRGDTRGDTAYPRSYGRDYSGRGGDQDGAAAAPPSDPYGGYQTGGYASGYPAGGEPGTGEDYSASREYRSYRRGEYRPRDEYGGGRRDPYTGEPARSRRDVLGVVASSLFAVLAVLALVTVLWLIFRNDDDSPASEPDTTPNASGSPGTGDPSATPSDGATPAEVVKAPVVVLNSVEVEGLAGSVTDQLREADWETRDPDNYSPRLAQTTVFYPEDLQDAANSLKAAFPDILEVEPADASMAQDALTLVIGENWPTS